MKYGTDSLGTDTFIVQTGSQSGNENLNTPILKFFYIPQSPVCFNLCTKRV